MRVAIAVLGTAVAGGLVVGALTSVGQTYLPFELAPLANSSTAWCVAAFALVLAGETRRSARDARTLAGVPIVPAVAGALALMALLAGYDVVTLLRDFAVSASKAVFWIAASLVAGPALGTAAFWIRGANPMRLAASVALVAGIAIGEAAYGLTVIAESTSGLYWTVQGSLGVLAVLGSAARIRNARLAAAICVILSAAVAIAFLVAYSSIS